MVSFGVVVERKQRGTSQGPQARDQAPVATPPLRGLGWSPDAAEVGEGEGLRV